MILVPIGARQSERRHAPNTAIIIHSTQLHNADAHAASAPIMTDKPSLLSTQSVPSQLAPTVLLATAPRVDPPNKVELVEEEPYTIKCICNFSDDDGNTIYCERCDTWQHIECFYPDNREEAIREDFSHACAECHPRPLNREKAIERALQLNTNAPLPGAAEKKTKRPPAKSHKKKPKPLDSQLNGHNGAPELGKNGISNDHAVSKKAKSSHRPSHSVSSQAAKRSPPNTSRPNPAHPPSPANTPPDLPDDFQIHHYSPGFCSLYNQHIVPDTRSNNFITLAVPDALARWLHEPETMKQEVGRTHREVFQSETTVSDDKRPKIEVKDATQAVGPDTTLRWRFLKSTTPIEKDVPLMELNGQIGFQKDYCADNDNLWSDLSSPLPFVFFHPVLPLYIDTRKEGSPARYVRRSCKPNAQLDTYLFGGSEYRFWLVSDQHISADEQITLPWDFRLKRKVGPRWLHFLGLSEEDHASRDEREMDEAEYTAISNWIDRILSEYGGCACELENNCAFARFHRRYLHSKNHARSGGSKKKQRKPRTHTISPTSTGHATNSRAASEGHGDDGLDQDGHSQSGSVFSKPTSRDHTPLRQGSFDQLGILTEPTDRDKRKVAMVEDSFRRMEQQQPPRKKKRASDGTANPAPSKKSRNGSVVMHGQYVDVGTSRSKSGSPTTSQSPKFANQSKPTTSRRQSSAARPRRLPVSTKPVYCDAGVQTDPVEGEWFSGSQTPPRPKKRIISLSKRLLESKHRLHAAEDEQRRRASETPGPSISSAMDIDSPTCTKATSQMTELSLSGSSEKADVQMPDAPSSAAPEKETLNAEEDKPRSTPDLKVQLPPVPAFEDAGVEPYTTPTSLSASSSIARSPLSNGLPAPPVQSSMGGLPAQPSSGKKKLSLSDYTKSRLNKAAGKPAGITNPAAKPDLSGQEEPKSDDLLENQPPAAAEESKDHVNTSPAVNGS